MKQLLLLSAFLAGSLSFSVAQETKLPENGAAVADTITGKTPTTDKVAIQSGTAEKTPATRIENLFDETYTANAPRLNPRAVSFVEDYIGKHTKNLNDLKGWALPYFNMMDGIFGTYGLPRELKYLAVIESKLKARATSWAGAVGPWQFMKPTAIRMGLKVTGKVDERTHYVKSTHAAARYLRDLYNIYGDWLLVIAAYNAGPAAVQKAISRSGSRNFWDLQYFLPAETRNHVKKFIGTHYVFEGQGGLTTLTKSETNAHYGPHLYAFHRQLSKEEEDVAMSQQVSGKYQSAAIVKHIVMDPVDFNRYNPDFDKVMSSSTNTYDLKLPPDKMNRFNANKYNILQESVQILLSSAAAMK